MPPMKACYHQAAATGILAARRQQLLESLTNCRLCPRHCGVNRNADETGYCQTGREAVVSSFHAHYGEESPLVGRHGSGTIFFSGCNLLCNFCQNYEISHGGEGQPVMAERLADMMLALQEGGCHNINLVTPSHVVPQILAALEEAVERGLHIPLVYNSSGYDAVPTLQYLEGIVDIYMPDVKFWNGRIADQTCHAPDYPEIARAALTEMHRQVGDLIISKDGIALRGLLVRHLVMPNNVAGTDGIMQFLAQSLSPATYTNVMSQYRPCGQAGTIPKINRRITSEEYQTALSAAQAAGLTRLDGPRRLFSFSF